MPNKRYVQAPDIHVFQIDNHYRYQIMADVFLSYATEDRDRIRPIAEALTELGWDVWWDRQIPAGRTFDEVIEEELEKAKCVLVGWSKASIKSRWVRTEAGDGANREIIVPFLLDDVEIPLAFRRIQAAQLTDWDGSLDHPGMVQIIDAIELLSGQAKASTATQKPTPIVETKHHETKKSKGFKPAIIVGIGIVIAVVATLWVLGGRKQPTISKPATPQRDVVRAGGPVEVVRIHMSSGGSLNSHGFITPQGKILAFAPTKERNNYFVSWLENGKRQEAQVRVLKKRQETGMAPFLTTLALPARLRPKVKPRIRNARSLVSGESVERYLSPTDRSPGKVLEVSIKRSMGKATITNALITTPISGMGDAGAPIIDDKGNIVAVLVGGGQQESISIPIENVKIVFQDAF